MAITKSPGRQEIVAARKVVAYSDPADDTGASEALIEVPAGAIVIGGYVYVSTAFDSTTSDALDIGDGDDVDRYTATPIDLQSTGVTALDVTGYKYTAQDNIDIQWTAGSTGTATAGQFEVVVEYIVEGRAAFSQG